MRTLPALTLLVLLLGLGFGCPRQPAEAPQARVVPPTTLNLSLAGARPGGKLAQLSYAVDGPIAPLTMALSDPQKPQGAQVKLPLATLNLKPFIMKPKITDARLQECKVDGCYTLCVRDSEGLHVGDFEVNDWGALVLKDGTVADGLIVERGTSPARTVYFVFRQNVDGSRGALRLALEYERNEFFTEKKLRAADGWHYSFNSPDGVLYVHDPSGVTGLLDELRLAEAEMEGLSLAELEAWSKKRRRSRSCTGGG